MITEVAPKSKTAELLTGFARSLTGGEKAEKAASSRCLVVVAEIADAEEEVIMFGKKIRRQCGHTAASPAPQAGSGDVFGGGAADSQIPDLNPAAPKAAAACCTGRRAPRIEPPLTPRKSENYYDIKSTIFNALIDAIDLTQLGQLDRDAARDEIRDIVNEIITLKDVVMSIAEQEELLEDICNDVLGYGPLEPLLARDDIADIMVNGAHTTFIEVGGKMQLTGVRFRDNCPAAQHLPAHRQPGWPPRRRSKPDMRRALAGWLARQRHRRPARHRWTLRSPFVSSRRTG